VSLSSTMGPGVSIDVNSALGAEAAPQAAE
jgi:hypothetical protein